MISDFLLLVKFIGEAVENGPEILENFFTEHPKLRPPPDASTNEAIEDKAEAAEREKFDKPDR